MAVTTMTSPLLTARRLSDASACPEQVALFELTFPKGAPLTVASLKKARAAKLSVLWAAALLDAPAKDEYQRVNGIARAEYWTVNRAAWNEFPRLAGPAWDEYQRLAWLALLAALRATFRRTAGAT